MYDSMNRNQWLDVLRGVAILLVLGRHSSYAYVRPWAMIGWSGVDVFFVLSGFLISGLLFSEYQQRGCIYVKQFWIRRAFKDLSPVLRSAHVHRRADLDEERIIIVARQGHGDRGELYD